MKIAAAYIRVSTDDQLEMSPDSQKEEILAYAKRNSIAVPEEFIYIEGEKKKGLSGRKASNRPKFQEMIARAKSKPRPFDCILLWKFSRFARNIDEATYYKSILRNKCGIDVVSISEPIIEGMYGRLIEMIIEWSDEFYSFNLATEVKRGMTAKAKAGEFCSYAPMGYVMDNKRLIIDEKTAPVVKRIFEEYASGGKVRSIVRSLNEQGVRTRYGNPIDNRFITYMISNPIYKGEIVFSTDGKRGRHDGEGGERLIKQRGIHEPIVSDELFNECYERYMREKTARHRESKKNDYALKSLLKCGNCSSSLTFASNGRIQCASYNRGVCRVSHSMNYEAAEREIINQLRKDLLNDTFKTETKEKTVIDNSAQIKSAEKKLARLDDAYLGGAYSPEEYKNLRIKLKQTITNLKEQQQASEKSLRKSERESNIKSLLSEYENMPPLQRNKILMTCIEKIVAHKTDGGYDFEIFYI